MNSNLTRVQSLVKRGAVRISAHGYDELAEDGIFVTEILKGLADAAVIEDYPTAILGPCVLVLQVDSAGRPIHVVWGIPRDRQEPATLVTAYRPDPVRWSADFMKRKNR
jgi:Domain of unknown function (DUF4258)